jgi:hypothetical protein
VRHSAVFFGHFLHKKQKETQKMKNSLFLTSRRLLLLVALPALSLFGFAQQEVQSAGPGDQSKLVRMVREATKRYLDVNNAVMDGYGAFLGCVSGSDHGAMGIHYVNGALLNGTIDVNHPQALIYEPSPNGQMKLVGVEFITDAATWLKNHNNQSPALDGQVFLLVDSPNRYAVPNPFYELHVWAWRDNPHGAFVDWNDHVTCAHSE